MSRAPVPSLGPLWAQAGAPAAFVRRDTLLGARIERFALDGAATHALGDTRAFAQLVAPFSYADALGHVDGDPPASDAHTPQSSAAPDRGRQAAEDSLPQRRTPCGPAMNGVTGTARPSSHAASIAGARDIGDARVPAEDHATRAATDPVGQFDAALRSPPESRRAGDAAAETGSRVCTVPFAAAAAASAQWRKVPPVRREPDAAIAARIAAALGAGADPLGRAPVDHARAHGEGPTGAASPSSIAALLGGAVRRVEQRLAAAALRRRHPDRNAPDDRDAHDRHGRRPSRNGEHQASDDSAPSTRDAMDVRRSVGLRGLVERTAMTAAGERAPFLAALPDVDEEAWPSGELDRFASLLDEAARHEGVDIDEGVA